MSSGAVPLFSPGDVRFMRTALKLSEFGRGFTEPNPLVGAVVAKGNRMLAAGYHSRFGRPHAEREALKRVVEAGTTLYVTLEPCCHFGKTPPCTELLIEKRVEKVVLAMIDPNPQVNGRGMRMLQQHGLKVGAGLLADEAAEVNRHYLTFIRKKRPFIAVHAGMSLDGKMSDCRGGATWVTDEELRKISHSLRGEFMAILAGRGTIVADNPLLTLRDVHWPKKKLFRVVLDPQNSLASDLRIFSRQTRFPLIIFSWRGAKNQEQRSEHHFFVNGENNRLALAEICHHLHDLGIASLLVEGGGRVIDSFIRAGLVDEYYLFFATKLIGGATSIQPFASGVESLAQSLNFARFRLLPLSSGFLLQGVPACLPEL